MSEKNPSRLCPECQVPVLGTQTSEDKDWFSFNCEFCAEEWGENIYYCTTDDAIDVNL